MQENFGQSRALEMTESSACERKRKARECILIAVFCGIRYLRTYFLLLLGLFVVPVASLLVRHLFFNQKVSFPLQTAGSNL